MQAEQLVGGELIPARLTDLLAQLPRAERRRFRQTWRFCREAMAAADLIVLRSLPGLDQPEQFELLVGYLIWRLRLLRRDVRRARLGA